MNFNIIKNIISNDKEFKDKVISSDNTSNNKLIKTKTMMISPLNHNSDKNLFNKINISNTQNLSLNETKKRQNDLVAKRTKIYIENRINDMSPQLTRIKIKNELSMSPGLTYSLEKNHQIKLFHVFISLLSI